MVKQGLKDEEIYEKFCGIFKNAQHVRGASSIKYCRTGFMKQEEYSQEKYWEDSPGKIGFVLGRHDAGVYKGQVVADVMLQFPTHIWAPHIKPLARCIEFPDYTRDNSLVEPVLNLTVDGVSPENIFETANENGISLDDIYYIMARFGMKVDLRPTAWDNSNSGRHLGASSAGANTSQATPDNSKPVPLVFQLPPTDSYKKSKAQAHGPKHSSHRSSDTSSHLPHHRHEYEYINRAGNQVAYRGVQLDLGVSLLNSGYPQEGSAGASSQSQLLRRRYQQKLLQPSQQHGMSSHYPHISQDGQLQHPMAQQLFGQHNLQEYTRYYPSPTIQPSLPGQFHQQNWDSTDGRQQIIWGQSQSGLEDYQQVPNHLSQRNYDSSLQPGYLSYQAQPGHDLIQTVYPHSQRSLAQGFQQPVTPITGYKNIDPALLRMDSEQPLRSDTAMMTRSKPPLTPRIAPQDYLHSFVYSGNQSGQDVSPLTIENPQFPILLPPSPEVAHEGFEHRGQSTIPDPFAQRSTLIEQPQLGLGTDLRKYSGTNGFDQFTFDQALTLSSGANATTFGHENSRGSIDSVLDTPGQRGNQKRNGEGPITEQAGRTAVEETVAIIPIINQMPLSEAQPLERDDTDDTAKSGNLSELFPDHVYQNPQGCKFNYEGSMFGSGIGLFGNDFSQNNLEAHGPEDKWPCHSKSSMGAMEAIGMDLKTRMAGPFLTQDLTGLNSDGSDIQCRNPGIIEDSSAPEGTCCSGHQGFECYFEMPDLDSNQRMVSQPLRSFTVGYNINYHFSPIRVLHSPSSSTPPQTAKKLTDPLQHKLPPKMSQPAFQSCCSACKTTAAQWARANASIPSKLDLNLPGKPYPIPPSFGPESHPYARQIGDTECMIAPEPEVSQDKVWIRPEYNVVVKKIVDMDYVKELIANILPPGSKPEEDAALMPQKPSVPATPGVPPRKCHSGLEMDGFLPPPRPYVPTPPYEGLSGFRGRSSIPKTKCAAPTRCTSESMIGVLGWVYVV
ncbi:hypothetical protein V493_07196 [Pseudogymnoascus sp. VKM F-4281 (FW-2241)]|nr:hypothetical protein V493_07196 [Pseudogymnoascus sp. VKM F-4281 (FW-2241)]